MIDKKIALEIVELLGGKDNIDFITHCVTRLRIKVKDDSLVDKAGLEKVEGVAGYANQIGQHQLIIGAKVNEYFKAVSEIVGDNIQKDEKVKFSFMSLLDILTSIIAPIIPAFCAAGMLKAIMLLLTTVGICTGEEGAYILLDMIADTAFYFLPILIANSAAKRFNTNQGLAICVAGALVYPSFVTLVNEGTSITFFGLNVPLYSYSSTIFPALFGTLLLSYIYKWLNNIVKSEAIKPIVVPALTLAIVCPITFLALAPLGNWGAELLGNAFIWMIQTVGPLAGLVIGFFMPIMTLTGLHQSLTPVEIFEMASAGYSLILPIELFHNLAEAGATLGTAVSSKDVELKATAYQTGMTALIGVSEPALYGVAVKNKKTMISAMVANGLGGFFGVLFGIKGYAFVWPNIFSIPSFLGTNLSHDLIMLIICLAITFLTGFILSAVLEKISLKNK